MCQVLILHLVIFLWNLFSQNIYKTRKLLSVILSAKWHLVNFFDLSVRVCTGETMLAPVNVRGIIEVWGSVYPLKYMHTPYACITKWLSSLKILFMNGPINRVLHLPVWRIHKTHENSNAMQNLITECFPQSHVLTGKVYSWKCSFNPYTDYPSFQCYMISNYSELK